MPNKPDVQHVIFAAPFARDSVWYEVAVRVEMSLDWELLTAEELDEIKQHTYPDNTLAGGARRGEILLKVAVLNKVFDPEYIRSTLSKTRKAKHSQIAAPGGFDYAAELIGPKMVTYIFNDGEHEWWFEFETPKRADKALLAEFRNMVCQAARQWRWPQVDYDWLTPRTILSRPRPGTPGTKP